MKLLNNLVNLVRQIKPLHTFDYCHLETKASKDKDAILMTTHGLMSAIDINGLNKLVGKEESADAHAVVCRIIEMLIENGHELDWGFSQNPLDTDRYLAEYQEPLLNTGKSMGLDLERQLKANADALKPYVRPEFNIMYIITPLRKENIKEHMAKVTKQNEAIRKIVDNMELSQSLTGFNESLLNEHESMVENVLSLLVSNKYTASRLTAEEIPQSIKRDATYKDPEGWSAKMWGDEIRFRVTPEDDNNGKNLHNWSALPLGMQIHDSPILPTQYTGIAQVGDYYVAPLLVEMIPESNSWLAHLLHAVPNHIPFRYRIYVKKEPSFISTLNKTIAGFTGFSEKHLKHNSTINKSWEYVDSLADQKIPTATVMITFSTWNTNPKVLQAQLAELKTKIQTWGKTQIITERGDLAEAVISTIPGYSTKCLASSTVERISEIAKLTPLTRPSNPFANEPTALRTVSGKLWGFSPTSRALPAYIEVVLAGSGSGKTVYQNAVNRDSNLKPGNKKITRHTTLDIGPGGKGTVLSLQDSLPADQSHLAIYEKLGMTADKAFNPFDLHLGLDKPTPLDMSTLEDLILILATPKGQEPTKLMAELISTVIDAAYNYYADNETAEEYDPGTNMQIDEALSLYPETQDSDATWGYRITWRKVTDFLFSRGHIREAKIANRYAVPKMTDLVRIASQTPTIVNRFSKAGATGMSLFDEFKTLMSTAAQGFPLLTAPTQIDFDDARYIVLDLNDVTQTEGSQKTAVMYSLAAMMGTRDFWLNDDDVHLFRPEYRFYIEDLIKSNREADLGVTFEEFRRTKGQKQLRSMINRWMAEGRKWGVRVQIVAQQPEHLDEEMIGHATIISILGTWNRATIAQLQKLVELSETEKEALMNGLIHGPRSDGSAMLMKYNLKSTGWGSQLVKLTKSGVELWASSSSQDDVQLRMEIEEMIGDNDLANKILCHRFPKGTADKELEREKTRISKNNLIGEDAVKNIAVKSVESWGLLQKIS